MAKYEVIGKDPEYWLTRLRRFARSGEIIDVNETDEEWADRCPVLKRIKTKKEVKK